MTVHLILRKYDLKAAWHGAQLKYKENNKQTTNSYKGNSFYKIYLVAVILYT